MQSSLRCLPFSVESICIQWISLKLKKVLRKCEMTLQGHQRIHNIHHDAQQNLKCYVWTNHYASKTSLEVLVKEILRHCAALENLT